MNLLNCVYFSKLCHVIEYVTELDNKIGQELQMMILQSVIVTRHGSYKLHLMKHKEEMTTDNKYNCNVEVEEESKKMEKYEV